MSLRTLPAELRLKIFGEVITEHQGPRNSEENAVSPREINPSLLKALRSDQELYQEALEVFYKKTTVKVNEENLEAVLGMSEDTLSLVHHLCISYSLPNPRPRHFTMLPTLVPTDRLLRSTAKTLKSLTLLFDPLITLNQACVAIPYELNVLVNSSTTLDSVTMILPNENDRVAIDLAYHGVENQQCVRDMMKTCREAMRINPKVWEDNNHQVFRIQFQAERATGRAVPIADRKGKGKMDDQNPSGEGSSGNEARLEWKEERIGDGWKGKCTCGHHEQEDHPEDEDQDQDDGVDLMDFFDPAHPYGLVGIPLGPFVSYVPPGFLGHDAGDAMETLLEEDWNWRFAAATSASSPENSGSPSMPPLIIDEAIPTSEDDMLTRDEATDNHSADTQWSRITPSSPEEPSLASPTTEPEADAIDWNYVPDTDMSRCLGWADEAEMNEIDDVAGGGWDDEDDGGVGLEDYGGVD